MATSKSSTSKTSNSSKGKSTAIGGGFSIGKSASKFLAGGTQKKISQAYSAGLTTPAAIKSAMTPIPKVNVINDKFVSNLQKSNKEYQAKSGGGVKKAESGTLSSNRIISPTNFAAQTQSIGVSDLGSTASPISLPTPPSTRDYGSTIQSNNIALGADQTTGTFDTTEATQPETPKTATQTMEDLLRNRYGIVPDAPQSILDDKEYKRKERAVNEQRQEVNTYQSNLNAIVAKAQQAQEQLEGQGRGIPDILIGGQQAQIKKEAYLEALPVQAQLSAAQGNLQLAQDSLDTYYKIRSQDIENKYNYQTKLFDAIRQYVDADTKAKLDEKESNNQFEKEKEKMLLQAELDEFGYSGYSQDGTSSPSQVATSTGTYDMATYATDPDYAKKLSSAYKMFNNATTPDAIEATIRSKAPNSRLTGQIVSDVAREYGLDPRFLLAQTWLESNFGTTGASLKNVNFGGVKYVGQSNATRGTLSPEKDYYANFNSVRDALAVQAREVANRKVGGNLGGVADTIIASGKFTKDQAKAIRKAIASGENPVAVIKNQAKNSMNTSLANDVSNYETAKGSIEELQSNLSEFYANGGSTNIFKGKFEKALNNLGTLSDPRLVDLAVQIQSNLQVYRNAVSGTAYSVQEGADIASIFPGINKTEGLNNAIMKGRLTAFDSTIDSAYRSVLGNQYDELKKIEKAEFGETPSMSSQSQVEIAPEKEAVWNSVIGTTGEEGGFWKNVASTVFGGTPQIDVFKLLGLKK